MIVSLAALLGVIGVLLVPTASQAAPAVPGVSLTVAAPGPAVSAQVRFPPFRNLGAILTRIFNSLPAFLQDVLGPVFAAILERATGGCTGPFCASP